MSIATYLSKGFSTLAVVSILLASGSASAAPDITGCWLDGLSGSTYYISQHGSEVWWVGMSPNVGATFTNSFYGTLSGSAVTGSWADVPRGRNRGWGSLGLFIENESRIRLVSQTGGFGGGPWARIPCP
jgi:hypothetical protein